MSSLAKYRKMRDFERTREPRGEAREKAAEAPLSFVVQKHAARNLHYDFRLELDGVLLSWAVPKGPSADPAVKRLAMEVEPHPLEYGDFEGTIPKGEYGGGTVMVWDRGTWMPEGDAQRSLAKGHLKFTLHGQKLKGAWHLVRSGGRNVSSGGETGKGWLLFKSRDEEAREHDTLLDDEPRSVLTGRDLQEIANEVDGRTWHSNRQENDPVPPAKSRKKKSVAKKHTLPKAPEPELATLVSQVPSGDDWLHEIKLDGYRVMARLEAGEVTLLTRNGKDWTARMPTLARALAKLEVEAAILDGELVALDDRGISNFQALQNALSETKDSQLVYYAFDLLHLNGEDLAPLPLLERKARLRELVDSAAAAGGTLRFSAHVVGSGQAFFDSASKLGLEGTIAKRKSSPYRPGRGRDWVKIKCSRRQELVVVGYTDPGGTRSHFGALLLAVREGGQLRYAGRVGTGFSEASLKELSRKLAPLAVKEPPVVNPPTGSEARGVHWVAPRLVAEVQFTEMTQDGHLRHPTFQGLRDDKPASKVTLEKAASLPAKDAPQYPLTNPDKVLYPELGVTKRELVEYYALVAERMLPQVGNRPLTLVRCPNGYTKQTFFQKHPGKGTPADLRSVNIREGEGKQPYSVLDDARGLFGLVQLAALEIHTWGSRADDFEHPDILVFDLDPDESVTYGAVIQAALEIRTLFESVKLESFVKSTGGKGLHVCVPIVARLPFEVIRDFTGRIAEAMAGAAPRRYVATASKSKRAGKIFIDYLRNGRGATFIAPYSTRARPNAPIATPLEWDELSEKLPPNHFNVRNIEARLAKLSRDPWAGMRHVQQLDAVELAAPAAPASSANKAKAAPRRKRS